MSYEVLLDRVAVRRLERLPDEVLRRVRQKLNQLELNPRPAGCKCLADNRDVCWRIRVCKYRILYRIDDAIAQVQVYDIDLRDKAYRDR